MPDLWLYWLIAVFLFGLAFRTVIAAVVHLIRAPVVKEAELQHWADRERMNALADQIYGLGNADRLLTGALHDHTHDDYAPLQHDHPHEHPHQHEHVQHVHTLMPLSRHEENGHAVIVKRCECGTIFRDEAG